ncbi:hypothetical protein AB0K74_27135 [Streptomyces sp. NPDC056159]|uniref:hypothetical protein n=1 Tax=Streptomyces sp. NPDC056159 TaxID=3155537 RepID=UPI0034192607
MEGWKFWWGIAAFFLGGLATQLNSWLTYRRQRKDKADEAADALRKRREEFELQHLVEFNQLLREAVDKLHDYSGAVRWYVHLRDTNSLDDAAEQRREEAADAFQVALFNVTAQLGFILADGIRHAAATTVGYMAQASGILHANGSLDVIELAHTADTVYLPLGDRVRAIYAGRP